MKDRVVFVFITASNKEEAKKIATILVKEKLIACANIVPEVECVYYWKGKLENTKEAYINAKTRESLIEKMTKRIKELHSYEVPCIVTFPITGGNKDFINWVLKETK